MEIPRTAPRLPDPACRLRRAAERWRAAVAALRRWFGMGPRPVPGVPQARRPQAPAPAPRRVILHLHRAVVVEVIDPPRAVPSPKTPPPRRKADSADAQRPVQRS